MYDSFNRNRIVIIVFDSPIIYKDYFMLTKLLHNSFINFQINSFTTCPSYHTIFFLLQPPQDCKPDSVIQRCELTLNDLKKFLTSFKRLAIRRYKIVTNYMDIDNINKKLAFIEELVQHNSDFKKTSLRQIKSNFIRKKESLTKKFQKEYPNINTLLDLLHLFVQKFEQRWSCTTVYSWHLLSQKETETSIDMSDDDILNLF